MGYVLNTEAMRVVNRNDRGNVVYRKRYKRGDEVDVSKMDEGHVQRLIEKGTLVSSEDDLTEPESAGATAPTSGPFGAATTAQTPGTTGPEAPGSESEEPHDVDEYDSMDYAALQKTAKERDLNAGGSADDLRARLRDDDES